jgi:hypothetical protein
LLLEVLGEEALDGTLEEGVGGIVEAKDARLALETDKAGAAGARTT